MSNARIAARNRADAPITQENFNGCIMWKCQGCGQGNVREDEGLGRLEITQQIDRHADQCTTR